MSNNSLPAPQASGVLTPAESETLQTLERTIDAGLKTFYAVGNALAAIRDERLYRESYKSFEDYLGARWGMSRPHAYRLIESAKVMENLSPIGDKPANEGQARELARLPAEQRADCWADYSEECEERSVKPTAAGLRAKVDLYLADAEPFVEVEDQDDEDEPDVEDDEDLDDEPEPEVAHPEPDSLPVGFEPVTGQCLLGKAVRFDGRQVLRLSVVESRRHPGYWHAIMLEHRRAHEDDLPANVEQHGLTRPVHAKALVAVMEMLLGDKRLAASDFDWTIGRGEMNEAYRELCDEEAADLYRDANSHWQGRRHN